MSTPETRAATPVRSDPSRPLYAAAAVLLLVVTLLGFQQFYLHGQAYPTHPLAPPIKGLLIAHGVAMSTWILLFLVQTLLVAGGNRKLHMTLGPVAFALVPIMVLLGLWLPIQTTRFEPDVVLWGLNRVHFMAIPWFSILTFSVFATLGLAYRRRLEIHRPMMLLATLAILGAASDRITGLPDLYAASLWGRVFGPFFVPLLIGVVFFAAQWIMTRRFNRSFAAGLAALILVCALVMQVAPTRPWEQFATFFVR